VPKLRGARTLSIGRGNLKIVERGGYSGRGSGVNRNLSVSFGFLRAFLDWEVTWPSVVIGRMIAARLEQKESERPDGNC
jgi:hypothetical protein